MAVLLRICSYDPSAYSPLGGRSILHRLSILPALIDKALAQKKDADGKQPRQQSAQVREPPPLVTPVCVQWLAVDESVLSRNSALSRCWCVGDQEDRSNERGRGNRLAVTLQNVESMAARGSAGVGSCSISERLVFIRLTHFCCRLLFVIAKPLRSPMDPGISLLHVGPQGRCLGESFGQENAHAFPPHEGPAPKSRDPRE